MKEGADRIVQRVVDDAHARAESIKSEAEEKAKTVESEARQRATRKEEHILEQARKGAAEQKGRIIGVAQLETRKDLLAAKQELIGEAFQKALDELINMDDRTYLSVIRDLLLSMVETGSETVIFSARDKERISDDFWKEINETLVSQGKKGKLELSQETRDIQGGFILQAGGVEMNCSFESLLEMKRDELEPEVAEMLFK